MSNAPFSNRRPERDFLFDPMQAQGDRRHIFQALRMACSVMREGRDPAVGAIGAGGVPHLGEPGWVSAVVGRQTVGVSAMALLAGLGLMAAPQAGFAQYLAGGATQTGANIVPGSVGIGTGSVIGTSNLSNAFERFFSHNGVGALTLWTGSTAASLASVAIGANNNTDVAGNSSGIAIGDTNQINITNFTDTSGVAPFPGIAIGYANEVNGPNSTDLGFGNTASSNSSIAIGVVNVSSGRESIAEGRQSTASGDFTIALGNVASATGTNALALGNSTQATGQDAIAIGAGANGANGNFQFDSSAPNASATNAVAIGTASNAGAANAVAFGPGASASAVGGFAGGAGATASGANAVAMGANASASTNQAVALGAGASASIANSVALGAGSATTAATPTNSAVVGGVTYGGFAGTSPSAVVSVGGGGAGARQIQNVAAGQITASDGTSTPAHRSHTARGVTGWRRRAAHRVVSAHGSQRAVDRRTPAPGPSTTRRCNARARTGPGAFRARVRSRLRSDRNRTRGSMTPPLVCERRWCTVAPGS